MLQVSKEKGFNTDQVVEWWISDGKLRLWMVGEESTSLTTTEAQIFLEFVASQGPEASAALARECMAELLLNRVGEISEED